MIESIVLSLAALLVIGAGMFVTSIVARRIRNRRALWLESVQGRGSAFVGDLPFMFAMLMFWFGTAMGTLVLLPGVVWLTGDAEAGEITLRMSAVVVCVWFVSGLLALPSFRAWVLGPDGFTRHTLGRHTTIPYEEIRTLTDGRIWPTLKVSSEHGSIRVSKNLAGYDDLFNQLLAAAPHASDERRPGRTTVGHTAELGLLTERAVYSLNRTRLRLIGGFIVSLLVFFLAWPWIFVDPEIRIPDAIYFDLMGLVIWAIFAGLLAKETFQRDQPAAIELGAHEVRWRVLRGQWHTRRAHEVVSATAETSIIYVKGMPGYRYPMRVLFTDGTTFHVDDFRARHLGSSTQMIAADIRRRLLEPENRTPEHADAADEAERMGREADEAGHIDAAIGHYRRAIALHPTEGRVELHARVATLFSSDGRYEEAVSARHSHLDHRRHDAVSWQELAADLDRLGRKDSSADAMHAAEKLLLSGTHR
ncbi:MAG: hypothetical protein ACR2P0_07230 [Acidimicrobiales bacterium]